MQYHGVGKFEPAFVDLLENGLLAFRARAGGPAVRFCNIRDADIKLPKSKRKGYPHALVVRVHCPGTNDCEKYVLGFEAAAEQVQWQIALQDAAAVSDDAFQASPGS